MIIGVTGEIASGKSLVTEILEKRGYKAIIGDEIARLVVEPGKPAYIGIVEYFGRDILKADRTINREKLGDIVFSDHEKLLILNDITHKYIYIEIVKLIENYKKNGVNDIVIDAALLFEVGLDKFVNQVWYIESDRDIRIKRLISRNNLTLEQAKMRVDAQNIWQNKNKADVVIENNGDKELLTAQVLKLINSYFFGVIILESLSDQSVMNDIDILEESDVAAPPDDPYSIWSRRLISVPADKVEEFAQKLSSSMKEDFYNHLVNDKTLIVIFKGKYFILDKRDKATWKEMIRYGETVNVGSQWTTDIPVDENNLLT